MTRFVISPEASTVVVEARSSVGPIAWEAIGPVGDFEVDVDATRIQPTSPVSGHLEIALDRLSSGNSVYDAELLRRVDARRHPTARVELRDLSAEPADGRFRAHATLRFHGVERPISGELEAELRDDGTVLVSGDQQVDIRDFGLPAPTMLMLKVYPDVRVFLVVEAVPAD